MSKVRYNVYVDTGRTDADDQSFKRLIGSAWRGTSPAGHEYINIELDALPPTGKCVAFLPKEDQA